MNLQFFASDPAGGSESGKEPQNQQQNAQAQAFTFDYEKLASIVAGKQTVTEDTVLKNYFKQQGLRNPYVDENGNTILTPQIIANEALMVLQSNLVMANLVHRDYSRWINLTKKKDKNRKKYYELHTGKK